MAFLRDVSDRIWRFVSPSKTQARRDKPFKVPLVPIKKEKTQFLARNQKSHSEHGEMSLQTRVRQWEISTPASNEPIDPSQLPPSPPRSLERKYADFDNETIVEEIGEMNPEGEVVWDANEDTFVAEDGDYTPQKKRPIDVMIKMARREEQARNLCGAGWAKDAVFLFQKLNDRGHEPLLPARWINDFEMLPEFLFTPSEDAAFVKATDGSDFHAQKALSELFNVGPYARDAVLTRAPVRTAEKQIRRAIIKYNKWAMDEDGGFATIWNKLSLFHIHTCPKNVSPKTLEAKATRQLGKLAARWGDAFRDRATQNSRNDDCSVDYDSVPDVPTLYGILASHTVMAFVSYDVLAPNPCLRTIAMFDFGQENYDVWNSFAIAIFVIHCRNRMIELEDYLPAAEATTESDPDL